MITLKEPGQVRRHRVSTENALDLRLAVTQRGQFRLLLFTRYHHDDEEKEDETNRACGVKNMCLS